MECSVSNPRTFSDELRADRGPVQRHDRLSLIGQAGGFFDQGRKQALGNQGRRGLRFAGTQAIKVKAGDVPGKGKEFLAFDLYTGRIKKSLVKSEVWPTGHHHRCYRNKATERYFISSSGCDCGG